MKVQSRWRRSATALAAVAAVVPLAIAAASPASASAQSVIAPLLRTATTTSYNTATFLQDDLGFSTADTSPVVQPVTYDEFQWLLQQSGNSAFLIGDPGEDANFKAEAQDVEAEAEKDGVHEIYWFDPNLSGGTGTSAGTTLTPALNDNIYEPNLDIRNPSGITSLSTASQVTYGNVWLNVVGQYLGDGATATPSQQDTEEATVTATTGTTTVNDYGVTPGYSTKIVDGVVQPNDGALYDYPTAMTSGTPFTTTPASTDSYFFIYNNANTVNVGGTAEPEKIVSWVDLDSEYATAPADIATDVDAAIAAVPGASSLAAGVSDLTDYTQFDWWLSEADAKNVALGGGNPDGQNIPLLTSADDVGGWNIDQITYPELVDLLKNGANTSNAAILFGGTWCPNTRPVIPYVNQYAKENNVTVFNFDTVLDGGTVGGSTTGTNNPLQSRNTVSLSTNLDGPGGTSEPAQNNPTFLYGDLVSTYLKNINTQYTDEVSGQNYSYVTYYPGGNTATPVTIANKLQVPFLIGYQASNGGGVTRQWIINNGDNSYTEYMSDWEYTNPQPGELGLSTGKFPADLPIWATLNAELPNVTWATNPATIDPSSTSDTDDALYLDSLDYATVTFTGTSPNVTAVKSVTSVYNPSSPTAADTLVSPAALSAALSALGSSAPVNYAAAKTALVAAENASTTSALTTELTTVVGAWGVAQGRKTDVTGAWGNATTPGSVIGGLAAVNALNVFFAGLPGGVVSTQSITADSVNNGADIRIDVAIANQFGRIPTGNVTLTLTQGSATIATTSVAVVNNLASFLVPISTTGTFSYTLSYVGDSQITGFTDTGALTVTPGTTVVNVIQSPPVTPAVVTPATVTRIRVSRVVGVVSKEPTTKAAGKYKVTITTPVGKSTATGTVTIKLKKGSITKTIRGQLLHGTVSFSVPKLASGTWKIAISWAGNSNYLAASATGASIKVPKVVLPKKKNTKK